MKLRSVAGAVVAALIVGVLVIPSSSGAIKAGTPCKKAGLQTVDSGRKYTCIKQGKKFVWNKGVVVKAAPAANPSPSATPSSSPSATPSPTPTPTKAYSPYELTKLKAYENIRAEAEKDGSKNIKLVYNISENVSADFVDFYRQQIVYASKLYGTFFSEPQVINVYIYTEKDQDFLNVSGYPRVKDILRDIDHWLVKWKTGEGKEHVLGGWAWYMQFNSQFQGHAGVFLHSDSTLQSHKYYAKQVLPHEYFHVVQDYFVNRNPKYTDQTSWDLYFAPIFREGSANTISFAVSSSNSQEYLNLYAQYIIEKKFYSGETIFATLKSKDDVVKALYSIRNKSNSPDAHEASYSIGSLLFEWVISEYGFAAYRKIVENQQIGNSFGDNIQASLGMSEKQLYESAAPHILAAFLESRK